MILSCRLAVSFYAIIDLIAAYYVFDITYPKGVDGILLFFPHFVFGIRDKQLHPTFLHRLCNFFKPRL